ncbi:MAG: hypothetical protein PHC56_12300 [Herbinix sp.]|nr:hypothetical protein [Herbinix sp.]
MKNKSNRHFLLLSIFSICLIITLYALNTTKPFNLFSSNNNKAWVSEIRAYDSMLETSTFKASSLQYKVSAEKLIDDSILIVRGKITDIIGLYDYSLIIEDGSKITVTRCLYDFDKLEVLKGNDVKSIKISVPVSFPSLEVNKEYVFCLYKTKGDYDDAYCLTGGTYQGSFDINGDVITNNTKDTFTLAKFNSLINNVLEKNAAGISVDSKSSKIQN